MQQYHEALRHILDYGVESSDRTGTGTISCFGLQARYPLSDGFPLVTTKKLLLRMQAPRFFVEKDEVVLSANIHNYLKVKKQVNASIEFDGKTLQLIDKANSTG